MTDIASAGIEAERGQDYGPYGWNHECIGHVWAGLLMAAQWEPGKPVTPDVCCAMMAGLKLCRGVHQWTYRQDTSDDAVIYSDFAGRLRKRAHESGKVSPEAELVKLRAAYEELLQACKEQAARAGIHIGSPDNSCRCSEGQAEPGCERHTGHPTACSESKDLDKPEFAPEPRVNL